MSHTNSTTNYNLPQFLTSDKPAWLTDVNNAFSDIDAAIYAAQTKADTAYADAGDAQTDATTAINDAAAADAKGSGAIASIESNFDPTTIYPVGAKVMYNNLLYRCIVAIVTPGPWTGSDNWERITVDSLISTTDSKIGSLTSLATTDKTSMVNAVNEVNGKVDGILHPTKIWSGSKYTLNDYIDIPNFDKNAMYMFEFMAFSSQYHTTFISAVDDGYLQFVISGDSTQQCRYRVQINTNSGRLTITDVTNGGSGQALVGLYAFT